MRRSSVSTWPGPTMLAIWFGHSSVLVEIDGVRLMTDPVLSDIVSPVPFGPKRMHAPRIALADLSGIDAVLISHDHDDHLDMKTIQIGGSRSTSRTCRFNLIKIGAYGTPPSWRADQDLGGGILLPVHWATFNLSYNAWDEPILRTLRAATDQHVQVVTPRVGEVVEIGQPFRNVEWYELAR